MILYFKKEKNEKGKKRGGEGGGKGEGKGRRRGGERKRRAGKMTQWVKELAPQRDDLSCSPRTHMVEKTTR